MTSKRPLRKGDIILKVKISLAPISVQGGSRFSLHNGRPIAYSDSRKNSYQKFVTDYLKSLAPTHPNPQPIEAKFIFGMAPTNKKEREQVRQLWHIKKPDHDNLTKSVQDALEAPKTKRKRKKYEAYGVNDLPKASRKSIVGAGIIQDDCQICISYCEKYTVKKGEQPFVFIKLKALSDNYRN